MPPAASLSTAASTSETSSGVSRIATSRTGSPPVSPLVSSLTPPTLVRPPECWDRPSSLENMTDDPPEQPNPFKGTPFEQLFSAFGTGGLPGMAGGTPGGRPDLAGLFGQMQAMMQP